MELHTFSSLMADFLPQYEGCMAQADVALVYFNPKVIEHKRLRSIKYDNTALLMMTSGTFDGVNIPEFARELIK